MDTSIDHHSQLLFRYGSIQTSPEHVHILNAQKAILFKASYEQRPAAGYQALLTGYANFVLQKERGTDSFRFLEGLLVRLRSTPKSLDSKLLKGSVSTFQTSNNYYRADYRVANGQVVVFNIQLLDKLQKARDALEKVGLYTVKRTAQGIWQVAGSTEVVATRYAAVNGQSNNLAKASWLMGSHLEYEFKNLSEYTLFHNPSIGGIGDTWESLRDKLGITTPVTKKFAEVLEATQKAGNETSWVAHSQGGAIFAEGVRYLLNSHSSYALNKLRFNGIRHPERGELLNKQSVAFHANANNNFRSKPLFERAGVRVLAIRANDYDMVPNIIGMNTLSPRKLVGSLIYSNHVFNGSVMQSPHTLMQDQATWDQNMETGPGKGRGPIQRGFNKVDKAIPNYLP
ncbi:MAG: hypothetical protein ACI4NJ_05265 [Cellvibrio sp.]